MAKRFYSPPGTRGAERNPIVSRDEALKMFGAHPYGRVAALAASVRGDSNAMGDKNMAFTIIAAARVLGVYPPPHRSIGLAMTRDKKHAVYVSTCFDGNVQMTIAKRGRRTLFLELVTTAASDMEFDEAFPPTHAARLLWLFLNDGWPGSIDDVNASMRSASMLMEEHRTKGAN